jgi:hypothetical protein
MRTAWSRTALTTPTKRKRKKTKRRKRKTKRKTKRKPPWFPSPRVH